MKAHKAREKSIEPQYKNAMEQIKQAIDWGWDSCHINSHGELYLEVAKMLVKDGFDIKIVLRDDAFMTYNEASWRYAEKGREGTLTYVDERKKKFGEDKYTEDSDLTSFFIQALFQEEDKTDDEKENGVSAEEQEATTDEAEASETSQGTAEETDEGSAKKSDDPSDMTDEAESNSYDLEEKESEEAESNSAELETKETGCSDNGEEQETTEEEAPAADAEDAADRHNVLAATGGNTYHQMWDTVVSYMDDDIREKVHAELTPCSEEEFLAYYLELDPTFLSILENIPSDQEIEE